LTTGRRLGTGDLLLAVMLLGVTGALALLPVNEVDLYWHLAIGRFIAAHHAVPALNLWSFTAPEHEFVTNSWLYDLGMFLLHRAGGVPAIQGVNAVVLGSAFALCFLAARLRGASRLTAATVTLLAALGSLRGLSQRPQAFTDLGVAATAVLLLRLEERWSWKRVGALTAVVVLWANLHSGVVFAPVVIGGWAIAWLFRRSRGAGSPAERSEALRRAIVLVGLAAAAVVVTPVGLGLVRYAAFHIAEVERVLPLEEFGAPLLSTDPLFWLLVAASAAAWPWTRKEVPGTALLPAVFLGLFALGAVRLVPQFLLLLAPILAVQGNALTRRVPGSIERLAPWRPVLAALLVLGAAWVAPPHAPLRLVTRIKLGSDPWRVPLAAADWARQQGISGRCFAGWDVTGLVEWAFPSSPVQIDPRLPAYPANVFHELAEAESSQQTFDALVDRYGIEWVFRSHRILKLSGVGRFRPDRWALVYWDQAGMVFLRRDVPRFQPLVQRFEYRAVLPADSAVRAALAADGPERARWLEETERLQREAPALVDLHVGLCADRARHGDLPGARAECDRALALSKEREKVHGRGTSPVLATGLVLLARAEVDGGDTAGSETALAQALRQAPDSAAVWTGVGTLFVSRDPARARAAFERALSLQPDFAPAAEQLRKLAIAGTRQGVP
jgi:hypothetical protein